MDILIIAAFAKIVTAGNLAGVAIVNDYPSVETMQEIATELNHSETAFVKPIADKDHHFEIRWFTPKYEVDLCGHATMAAAFALWHTGVATRDKITFIGKSGELRALRTGVDDITLDFLFETTSPLSQPLSFDWKKALGGVEPVYVGEAFGTFKEYLVELPNADEVINLEPNIDEIAKLPGNGVIVTAKGFDNYDMVSRVFAPQDGIPEDPVCISAHCKLAHFWEQRLQKSTLLAYQASARTGVIKIEHRGERVFMTGQAVLVDKLVK